MHGSFCGLCLAQAQIFDLVHVYVSFQLLMEFTGGQNLNIYLTRKTLSLDVLRCYTIEIVEALEYLHNKAVVHKNLRVSQSYMSSEKTLPLDILRSCTTEILEPLKFLHNKAVVHKNLTVSQSYISYEENSPTRHSQILHYRDTGGPQISSQ